MVLVVVLFVGVVGSTTYFLAWLFKPARRARTRARRADPPSLPEAGPLWSDRPGDAVKPPGDKLTEG
jgi:hypothetical protein